MPSNYPATPGYKDHETGREAAESMERTAPRLRRLCLQALKSGAATADEVAARLGLSILSIRPRITELLAEGSVRDTGERRRNESGRNAKVWAPCHG